MSEFAFGYEVTGDVWHDGAIPATTDVLTIAKFDDHGAGHWEFTMTRGDATGGEELRVLVYDDAFAAFIDIPDFFAGLAALGKNAAVEQVIALMDDLGFDDVTARRDTRVQEPPR